MPQVEQPTHHFIQRAPVAHIELGGIFLFGFRHGIASHAGARTAAYLRNAQFEHPTAYGFRLTGGNNHSRIRHRNAGNRHNTAEHLIRDGIGKILGRNIICRTNARYADGMRTHAKGSFQMFGMHQQSYEVVAIGIQTKQYTDTYIVDATLHSAVHRFGVVGIITFRSRGMQGFVMLFAVSLLKKDISADTCLFQQPIVFHCSGGYVDIHPADGPVLVVDAVDGADRL